MKVPITYQGHICERCNHAWKPKSEDVPRVCPKCKSPYWNVPKRTNAATTNPQPEAK